MRRRHRMMHLGVWAALALLLPGLLVGAYALRGAGPVDPAVRLPGTGPDQ